VENAIFLFFFNDLRRFEGCWQLCFWLVLPKWTSFEKNGELWISAQLSFFHAQSCSSSVLTLQGLLKNVQLLVQLAQLLTFSRDFSNRMQHRGMVPATEQLANFWQTFFASALWPSTWQFGAAVQWRRDAFWNTCRPL